MRIRTLLDFARAAAGDDLAVVDQGQSLAQHVRLEHVVRRQEDGLASRRQARDQRAHFACHLRVEANRRFVHEQDLGVGEEAAGDMKALLHAARVLLDECVTAVGEADLIEKLIGPSRSETRLDMVQGGEVLEVLLAGQAAVETAVASKDEPDVLSDLRRLLHDVEAQD